MKDAVIRARCSAQLKARVLEVAERLGLEEADIVRLAVTDYLNRHETGGTTATLTLAGRPEPTATPKEVAAAIAVAAVDQVEGQGGRRTPRRGSRSPSARADRRP